MNRPLFKMAPVMQFTPIASVSLLIVLLLSGPSIAQISDPQSGDDVNPDMLPDVTQITPLNEAELKAAFTNKTHLGTYSFSRPNIETFAFEERTTADGKTRHQQGSRIDSGTWRVKANVICFNYDDWYAGVNHCFNIYKRGNCFYHYGLSNFGLAGGSFTARSVHKGETPDCEPAFV